MLKEMLSFIHKSPVNYQAIDNLKNWLEDEGYEELTSGEWDLKAGGKYFLTRSFTSLIAFRIPAAKPQGFVLSAAHSDAPGLRLRNHAEMEGQYIRLESERYGGMINSTWVDRPLSVAGRVMVRTASGLESRLVDMKKDMAIIPNLAIHMNRNMNDSVSYDPAKNLIAVYSDGDGKGMFLQEIAEAVGCDAEDIVSTDLALYNNQPGTVWGPNGEFVSSPRLDDLACVFACTEGFLKAKETDRIPVLCVFDNEEIGSATKQGAGSEFLPRVLRAISEALYLSPAQHLALLDNSWGLSCDNGHAKHPNYPEYADKNEAPALNGGVVIKHAQKYCTDGVSSALFSEICRKAAVPTQHYANRADVVGGGTLGNIANTQTPVYLVDIGMAQWAMHSAMETAGSHDVEYFAAAVQAAYESRVNFEGSSITL